MGRSLQGLEGYLRALDESGGVVHVYEHVSPELCMAEVAHRALGAHLAGRVLLFHRSGTDFPVVMNLYSSRDRMLEVLRVATYQELRSRVQLLMREVMRPRRNLREKLSALGVMRSVAGFVPRPMRGRAPSQEVVMDPPDLRRLPVLKTWPGDGGDFLTLPMVMTVDPTTGLPNVGMYRMQVFDGQTAGLHWHMHKTGARHYAAYKARGERMPVAVALGGDPLLAYCASAPLPDGVNEWMLVGFLRGQPVRTVRARTCDLMVPAEADFIIEGYVDPEEELVLEGPFGDHTGFYSLADRYPRFHVTCITHRRNAVYPATVVGVPPMEDAFIAEATEQLFQPVLQSGLAPALVDLHLPQMGVAHNLALVSVRNDYPGQSQGLASLLWGTGQMMFTKYIVTLPEQLDPRDYPAVLSALARNVSSSSRLLSSHGPLDVLDHAASRVAQGGKLLIDAQGELSESAPQIEWKSSALGPCLWVDGVALLCAVRDDAKLPDVDWVEIACGELGFRPRCLVRIEPNFPVDQPDLLLWIMLANTDPGRDIQLWDRTEEGGGFSLGLDARAKLGDDFQRPWPNVVVSDPTTQAEVDARWETLGLGASIESPSHRLMAYRFGTGAIAEDEKM